MQSDLMFIEMLAAAKKPLEQNVRPGDRVVIVTDTSHDQLVWQVAAAAVRDLGGEPTVTIFPPRPADYQAPPDSVVASLKASDLGILLTTTSLLHAPGLEDVMETTPVVVMDGGLTAEMLTRGAVHADYTLVKELTHKVAAGVFGADASQVRMTCENGSDITLSVEGRIVVPPPPAPDYVPLRVERFAESDMYGAREGSRAYAVAFPGGEVNTAPIEDSANGVVYIDTCMHHLGRLEEPIRVAVEAGRIVNISGGHQADELRRYIATYGDDNSWFLPTEFSVGTNYAARVTGVQREDKNILGAIHVGLGRNDDVGGALHSCLHMDGIILRPTLMVDDELKIERGRILCLEEEGFYDRIDKLVAAA
jgi:2,5-dihydroxypyridine 5,6-dioxygenase